VEALEQYAAGRFRFLRKQYVGNIAYLAVLNSMILRIPLSVKNVLAPLLIAAESMLRWLNSKRTSCFVVCQWQKIA